jgi:hypothetical protein
MVQDSFFCRLPRADFAFCACAEILPGFIGFITQLLLAIIVTGPNPPGIAVGHTTSFLSTFRTCGIHPLYIFKLCTCVQVMHLVSPDSSIPICPGAIHLAAQSGHLDRACADPANGR